MTHGPRATGCKDLNYLYCGTKVQQKVVGATQKLKCIKKKITFGTLNWKIFFFMNQQFLAYSSEEGLNSNLRGERVKFKSKRRRG